ncbi:MAG: hypothetical protein WDN23_01570 [Edaphobacter sp.]
MAYIQAGIKLTAMQVDVKATKIHGSKEAHAEIVAVNKQAPLKQAVVAAQVGFAVGHTVTIPNVGTTSGT